MLKRALVSLFVLAVPSVALAHPGHGTVDSHQPLHSLVDHPVLALAALAATGIGVVLAARRLGRRRRTKSR